MEHSSIGSLSVSKIGLGCNQFGRKIDLRQTLAVVDAALDAGLDFFDTADRYGYGSLPFSGEGRSEEFLGEVLKGRRHRVILATKFGVQMGDDPKQSGGSRRWVMAAVNESLRRLQTDYIDLYQIHRPDPNVPIEETLEALNDLVREGKIREFGCSNFDTAQLAAAIDAGRPLSKGFVSVQNEYSLLCRAPEEGVLALCRAHQVAFVPYFPLAGGLLTGKYRKDEQPPAESRLAMFPPGRPHLGFTEENLDRIEQLTTFATGRGHTLLELAFAWLLAHDEVGSVVAGATRPAQVQQNAQASGWKLTEQERLEVDRLAGAVDESKAP